MDVHVQAFFTSELYGIDQLQAFAVLTAALIG
jgi:hypothetical protein